MKVEKIPIDFEKRFIAEDGTVWKTYHECEQYENLLADPSPLRNLFFFDNAGNPIDVFELKEIPVSSYLILTNPIKKYYPKVVQAFLKTRYASDTEAYALPTEEGIWFNDWSNALNGCYGSNGWRRVPTINEMRSAIENYQKKIELLQKMLDKMPKV